MENLKNKYFIVQWLKSLIAILPFFILTIGLIRDDLRIRFKDCLYGVNGIENAAENCHWVYWGLFYTYGSHIYLFLFLFISSGIIYFFYRKHIRGRPWFYKKRILAPILILFLLIQLYYTFIDFYNFWQFKKVLPILESIHEDDERLYGVTKFNEKYNTNLKPINKCYYVKKNDTEDRSLYEFSFRIESLLYIYIYKTKYFVYPKYNIPYLRFCTWYCYDENLRNFKELVSSKCEK